ncbi:hypothetical protein ACFONL_02340 [Camelimonas fluminis]|uniref:Uncharacterized protein n=1 Tax=Camelimonas fluminis TaxID=1576911 RepID=A0ABV7UC97_9HYPH|nr:hypothetical protein [Camelimonas fluminis]
MRRIRLRNQQKCQRQLFLVSKTWLECFAIFGLHVSRLTPSGLMLRLAGNEGKAQMTSRDLRAIARLEPGRTRGVRHNSNV